MKTNIWKDMWISSTCLYLWLSLSFSSGLFEFTWQQFMIGVQSSLIMFPVNILIVSIFRNTRPRETSCCKCKTEEPDAEQTFVSPSNTNNMSVNVTLDTVIMVCASFVSCDKYSYSKYWLFNMNIYDKSVIESIICLKFMWITSIYCNLIHRKHLCISIFSSLGYKKDCPISIKDHEKQHPMHWVRVWSCTTSWYQCCPLYSGALHHNE